jgi:DNA-binding SARP family transcriptional activator
MLALYRSGRQADALEAYHRARRSLIDELGLEPGPRLQDSSGRSSPTTPRSTRRLERQGRCRRRLVDRVAVGC